MEQEFCNVDYRVSQLLISMKQYAVFLSFLLSFVCLSIFFLPPDYDKCIFQALVP